MRGWKNTLRGESAAPIKKRRRKKEKKEEEKVPYYLNFAPLLRPKFWIHPPDFCNSYNILQEILFHTGDNFSDLTVNQLFITFRLREAAKKVLFLVARSLKAFSPPPLGLVAVGTFSLHKKKILSGTPV